MVRAAVDRVPHLATVGPRSQQARSAETRTRLLEAAAQVIAERGIEHATVDAIAEAAGRTSGSVYGHFGSKDALVFELLDHWKDEVSARARAELADADTLTEQLATLWRNVSQPGGGARDWIRLEHELWRWGTRAGHPEVTRRLRERYRAIWAAVAEAIRRWQDAGLITPPLPPEALAPVLVGLLLGLEMERRLDRGAVDDDAAVRALLALVGPAADPLARPGQRRRA